MVWLFQKYLIFLGEKFQIVSREKMRQAPAVTNLRKFDLPTGATLSAFSDPRFFVKTAGTPGLPSELFVDFGPPNCVSFLDYTINNLPDDIFEKLGWYLLNPLGQLVIAHARQHFDIFSLK